MGNGTQLGPITTKPLAIGPIARPVAWLFRPHHCHWLSCMVVRIYTMTVRIELSRLLHDNYEGCKVGITSAAILEQDK